MYQKRKTENPDMPKFLVVFVILCCGFGAFSCAAKKADEAGAAKITSAGNKTETAAENKIQSPENKTEPATPTAAPQVFLENCAKCHGAKGEGAKKNPELIGVTTRTEDRLTEADLLEIINDAKSFGLSSKMPSFKNKLSEDEKRQIIEWLKTLK